MAASHAPTPAQASVAPELCPLAILETALDVTNAALLAAQPELQRDDIEPSSAPARVAIDIIEQTLALRAAIYRYRLALLLESNPDGPWPF